MRRAQTRACISIAILLACCACAFALDPSLDISQYAHTSWKIRDGFTKGSIIAITQTPDGYLWLGTEFGLYRFDGVRAVLWEPPTGQQLPSNTIVALLASRDGSLWIGTLKGLGRWKDGKLTQYADVAGQRVFALSESRDATVWVGTSGNGGPGQLCGIRSTGAECHGSDGIFGFGVLDLFEDAKGTLWAGVRDGVWRWQPGPSEFFSVPAEPDAVRFAGEDERGLMIGGHNGVQRLVGDRVERYSLPGAAQSFVATRMLRERDGDLWIGTSERGLLHVHGGRTDSFSHLDGLSADRVQRIFEDREGSIWVATLDGLDRFRPYPVSTISVKQGLSTAVVGAVLARNDGSVLIGTDALDWWEHGQISSVGKLNGQAPHSLFRDNRGRIWASTLKEFGYLEKNRFVAIRDMPVGVVHSITETTREHLWLAHQEAGLFHLFQGKLIQQIPWERMGHEDNANTLTADPSRNGLWLGFQKGGVAYFTDGGVRASYSAADGLGEGSVNMLRFAPDGALWAATEGGLSRIKDGHIATLTSKNGLPCDAAIWSTEDDDHSVWLYMLCGLVHIPRSELDAWIADRARIVRTSVFDISDGVRTAAFYSLYSPTITKAQGGKIWFAAYDGVSVIDPHHLAFNKLPPPVHVEEIIADRKTYDTPSDTNGNLRLPPLIRDLEIDYTALSLVAPEKNRFRYKLEGLDSDWHDVGNRRQAFYSNLPPRNYRFRVIACNNSGVWNEAGTFLNFSVAPAYYQTWWFRSLSAAAFLALLAGAYQMRLRQVARQFNMRLEERVNERTRIARDLHDTLLQSFQGVLLKFHAVTYLLPDRPEAQKKLETVIEQARQAITEGRDAVQGLRSSTLATSDIALAISTFGEELTAHQTGQNSPDFRVLVEGVPRDLAPLLRDEVYRITGEALRNAFRHAHAQRIEVEIRYDQRQLRLRVRDNGKGIDPAVLNGGGRPGHYGLPGMHERAKLVGGKLAVWSEINSGTEAELTIPASIAYAKSSVARRSMFWGRSA